MLINYLEVEVVYTRRGKLKQALKLNEWARNQMEKKTK